VQGGALSAARLHVAAVWIAVPALIWLARRGAGLGRAWDARAALVGLALLDSAASVYTCHRMLTVSRERILPMREEHGPAVSLVTVTTPRRRRPPGTWLTSLNLESKVPYLEGYDQLSNRFHSQQSLTRLPTSWCRENVLAESVLGEQGRAWFASKAAFVSPSDFCFRAFVMRARELLAMPIVLHQPADLLHMLRRGESGPDDLGQAKAIVDLPPATRVTYDSLRDTSTELELRAFAPEDGWLLVTDRWARSWRAWVDAAETTVLGANFLFRAVPVSKGTHTIRFEFRPWGYPWLVLESWCLLALVGAVSILRAARAARRRSGSREEDGAMAPAAR
jgi:hypothetical protein